MRNGAFDLCDMSYLVDLAHQKGKIGETMARAQRGFRTKPTVNLALKEARQYTKQEKRKLGYAGCGSKSEARDPKSEAMPYTLELQSFGVCERGCTPTFSGLER